MKPSYHGNGKPYVLTLYHPSDESAVLPVLELLDSRGLSLCRLPGQAVGKSIIRRACTVVAFLSKNSVNDSGFESAVLLAKAEDVPLVCIRLDDAMLPVTLQSVLYADNLIGASRYETSAALTDRICTAETLKHPQLTRAQLEAARRTALLLIAGAVLVVAVIALLIIRRVQASTVSAEAPLAEASQQAEQIDSAQLAAYGITQEDLSKITVFILVGDQRVVMDYDYDDVGKYVTEIRDDDNVIYAVDGKEVPRGTITDLSLIGQMENLQRLYLFNQSCTDLTPLKQLAWLSEVKLYDVPVSDVSPLGQIPHLQQIHLINTDVTDLSPLSDLTRLRNIIIDGERVGIRSLNGLASPALEELLLSGCFDLTDISSLHNCTKLKRLEIENAEDLNDLSALGNCTALNNLTLRNVGANNLSPLSSCKNLAMLDLQDVPVRDLSFTDGMEHLTDITLHGTNVRDLGFINGLAGEDAISISFSGDMDDYSGLAARNLYKHLHVNPRDGNYAAVAPYIKDAEVRSLELYECNNVDFASVPETVELHLTRGNYSDLSGIDQIEQMQKLTLEQLNRLTSLSGLEESPNLTTLSIENCPRLTDIEALYMHDYADLAFAAVPFVPDFSRLIMAKQSTLSFNGVESLTDLNGLVNLPPDTRDNIITLALRNMDWLTNLSPIRQCSFSRLVVPPQLEAQARELLNDKVILTCEIAYPDDSLWQQDDGAFSLLSLDELDTLPEVTLARVREFSIVGDAVLDETVSHFETDWNNGRPTFCIEDNATGERTPVGDGAIADFTKLQKLTGLNSLMLVEQPINSLQGIQNLPNLHWLKLPYCPVSDASPVFTLTELEGISLSGTEVTSIAGIQNITRLRSLDLSNTKVSDISPLAECDFSYAAENEGLELRLNDIPCEDFASLARIPRFRSLSVNGIPSSLWLPFVSDKPVEQLEALGEQCLNNDDIKTVAGLQDLRELHIPWNQKLTDLSPLLNCETLEYVKVSDDMQKAIASIEGQERFQLEIEG